MLAAIAYALLTVFMLAGIVAGIYVVMMLVMRPKAAGRFIVVIPSQACDAEIAALLCAARLRMGLMGDIARGDVIALDCGMNEQCRLQCEALCRELDRTRLLKPEEFIEEFTQKHESLKIIENESS